MKYIGQTGRSFRVRFSEHYRDYKYPNNESKFTQHLLENSHSIGPIDNIMEVLYATNKGKLIDTVEIFHIYKETCKNNQINDKNTAKPNIIFETIVRENANKRTLPGNYASLTTFIIVHKCTLPYSRCVQP